ncbi:MAG: ribosome small subunit-dependent GTPase A [Clostridia bacterium]|nr:ribosome small subunit-dependent GTPase A [Clostridia bacterium]
MENTVYECKARGSFRKEGISPLAGDRVSILLSDDETGTVEEILPRRNCLVRPPIANLDCLAITVSVAQPRPNFLLLDTLIAIAENNAIEPVLVITKADLQDTKDIEGIYSKAGFSVFVVTNTDAKTVGPLAQFLRGKITAVTGNSGVGKSSLLNLIEPNLHRETAEISKKLGRGRHTTRSAELFRLSGGGYLADTAGFSVLDLEKAMPIDADKVFDCFREFEPYFGKCRFTGCVHAHEPNCAIREAVENGEISHSRYQSYVTLYEEMKKQKKW